jgi:hypothetical protein
MRDRYEPPTDPVVWQARPPGPEPGRPPATGGWYPDDPVRYDEPIGERRTQGLRRLSKLTWRATQLSAVAAVGFAALFAHTAHSYATNTAATVKHTVKPTASPSPSATKAKKHHHYHGAATAASPPAGGGSGGVATSAPAAASAPALAPPTTAPAPPPPSPAPTQTSSGGSSGG